MSQNQLDLQKDPSLVSSHSDRPAASSVSATRPPAFPVPARSVPSGGATVATVASSPSPSARVPFVPETLVAADETVESGLTVVDTSVSSPSLITKPTPARLPQVLPKVSTHEKRMAALEGVTFGLWRKTGRPCLFHRHFGYDDVLLIGSSVSDLLIRTLFRAQGCMLKQRELADINDELRSMALQGVEVDLFIRTAPVTGGGVEIDLCDGQGSTVCIDSQGVRVGHAAPGKYFLRSPHALALPRPADQGDFKLLRSYVNLEFMSFLLLIAWMTYSIAHPKEETSKYVFLVIKGTQGTGKSSACKLVQKLIDPTTTGAQTLPGSPRDLAIMSQQAHLLVFDNLRDLTPPMSDALCIAATGGTVVMRELYSDDMQKNLYLHGAMLFNGIHPFIGQSDFADRCLVLNLKPLEAKHRKSEKDMLAGFQKDYPVILRGLYDLIHKIFLQLPHAKVTSPSRMVDFCSWLAAMELAMGYPADSLQEIYDEFTREMQLESLQDNPLAAAILAFVENMTEPVWTGTPTKFYEQLDHLVSFQASKSSGWPSNAAVMSKRLHGLQAPLLSQGIGIELTRGKDRQIVVTVPKLSTTTQTGID